jgi:uncharacterized membrane protein YgcG
MRVEVVNLEGRTRFLDLDDSAMRVSELRARVAALTRIPAPLLRLKFGTRDLYDAAVLDPMQLAAMPVRVALRLTGGKGGFGAMLRTAGAKGIKTTNFDACRDLNGRRLRHVNSEQKLREWEAQAAERERKKQEAAAMRPAPGPPPLPRFDDDAHEEMLEATRRSVAEAVAKGTAAGRGVAGSSGAGGSVSEGSASSGGANEEGGSSGGEAGAVGRKRQAEAAVQPEAKERKLAAGMDPLALCMGEEGEDGESSAEEDLQGGAEQ